MRHSLNSYDVHVGHWSTFKDGDVAGRLPRDAVQRLWGGAYRAFVDLKLKKDERIKWLDAWGSIDADASIP